jgi:hypothetical protein
MDSLPMTAGEYILKRVNGSVYPFYQNGRMKTCVRTAQLVKPVRATVKTFSEWQAEKTSMTIGMNGKRELLVSPC